MGLLVDGKWHDAWYDTKASQGRFVRSEAQFRNWVTRDGSAGPTGSAGFRAEPNRYHLYVAFACPWAHRTLIFRKLKGLEPLISVSAVNSFMGADGWTFDPAPETIPDDMPGRDDIVASIQKATLLGRTATLADVGKVAAFVASDQAGTMTSATVNLSCGAIVDD